MKKARLREDAFFVDGAGLVLTAIEDQAPIELIVYCRDLLKEGTWSAIEQLRSREVECFSVSRDVFGCISDRNNPDGVGAVIQKRWHSLEGLMVNSGDTFLALFGISYPGNLGTILRTVDAVGAAGIILVGDTTDPFHPKTARASIATLFTVPICHVPDGELLLSWAQGHGLQTIATSAKATLSYWEAAYKFPALLMIGDEHHGLSAENLGRADVAVRIPMHGTASSLNVSIAASLLLYELKRAAACP